MMTKVAVVLGLLSVAVLAVALWADAPQLDGGKRGGEIVEVSAVGGGVDRCLSCHRDILRAARGEQAAAAHPEIPGHPDVLRHGCTPCHGGEGRRLDAAAHSPKLGAGPDPFLEGSHRQARCGRCHVPGDLAGADALSRGIAEYLDAGCLSCHQPGRWGEGLGIDFRRMGRRTEKELADVLLDPQKGHPESVMWSFDYRYADSDEGHARLRDLITALLYFSDDPMPYVAAWAAPTVRANVDCLLCHRANQAEPLPKTPHRCVFLRENTSLRCQNCHGAAPGKTPLAGGDYRVCPRISAELPLCAVCHRRPTEGAVP